MVTPPPSESPISGEAMGRVKIYPNADVLIEDDKIVAVGSNLESPSAEVVDVTGKVILPGFVDPHISLVRF